MQRGKVESVCYGIDFYQCLRSLTKQLQKNMAAQSETDCIVQIRTTASALNAALNKVFAG